MKNSLCIEPLVAARGEEDMKSRRQREREEFLELVAFIGTFLFGAFWFLVITHLPLIYQAVMGIQH